MIFVWFYIYSQWIFKWHSYLVIYMNPTRSEVMLGRLAAILPDLRPSCDPCVRSDYMKNTVSEHF